jgi:hypothetical protein
MAKESEIGTWQQIAAWEKSVGGERNIAPPPPKLKFVNRTERSGEEPAGDLKRSPLRP